MPYTRTILVTGANTGIGYALVRLLAQKGENVYLGSRNAAKGKEAQEKLGSEDYLSVKFVQIDITDIKSVMEAKATIENAEGKLDVLVNNAADAFMSVDKGTLSEDLSVIRQAFELNFFGTIQTTLAFLPLIRKAQRGYGSVQFVSTGLASNTFQASPNGVLHNLIAYNTSKTALNSYVIALAKKMQEEDTGITVNSVSPGLTRTKLNGFKPGGATPEQAAEILLPYAQLGPEDAATTCKFFGPMGEFVW